MRTFSLNSFGRRQLYQKAKPWMIQRRISIYPYQKKNGGCERKNYKKIERGVATLSRHILTKMFLRRDLTDDCLQFSVFSFSRSIFIWFLNIALSDCCFDFRLFFVSEVMDSYPWKIHLWVALMNRVHLQVRLDFSSKLIQNNMSKSQVFVCISKLFSDIYLQRIKLSL